MPEYRHVQSEIDRMRIALREELERDGGITWSGCQRLIEKMHKKIRYARDDTVMDPQTLQDFVSGKRKSIWRNTGSKIWQYLQEIGVINYQNIGNGEAFRVMNSYLNDDRTLYSAADLSPIMSFVGPYRLYREFALGNDSKPRWLLSSLNVNLEEDAFGKHLNVSSVSKYRYGAVEKYEESGFMIINRKEYQIWTKSVDFDRPLSKIYSIQQASITQDGGKITGFGGLLKFFGVNTDYVYRTVVFYAFRDKKVFASPREVNYNSIPINIKDMLSQGINARNSFLFRDGYESNSYRTDKS